MDVYEVQKDQFLITTNAKLLQVGVVHGYLTRSYWAKGIERSLVERALKYSLCFALLENHTQIGFARVITDYTAIGYLADVFVLETHQGKGLGRFLVETVLAHPELKTLRRFILVTADAHELYRKFGFDSPSQPEMYMDMLRPLR
ncbi:MAG: GNAT family N-acetyltransferase [Calditrichota bacterium]